MSWLQELDEEIRVRWKLNEHFALSQIYALEEKFAKRHPKNKHVRDKLRQTLQILREEGRVEFIDYSGNYERIL